MNKLLLFFAALGRLLEYVLDKLQKQESAKERADERKAREDIAADPGAAFREHFGVSKDKPLPGDATDANDTNT